MKIPKDGVLLRVFIGESDGCPRTGKPLYEALVLKARELHLAGATVLRGVLGYGRHSRIHAAKILSLSSDRSMVVEIVDSEEKIEQLMPWLDENVAEGLVTMERVRVLHYRSPEPSDS